MKKFIFLFAVAFMFVGVGSVSANTEACTTDAHPAGTSFGGIDYVACNGGGDPMKVTMVWGLIGYDTPQVKGGVTVTDETGIQDTCPSWFARGCFDLTRTEYYRNQMRATEKDLQAKGWISVFPHMVAWLSR